MALGCDMINVAREAMLAIGCIQAQRCHTGRCPVGHRHPLRLAHPRARPYPQVSSPGQLLSTLRHELLELSHACGVTHPSLVGPDRIEILDGHLGSRTAREIFGYKPSWG